MASTSNPPQHPGAYIRFRYMTWIGNLPRITASGRYALRPVSSPVGNCYRIDSPNPGEFFVLEYRKKTSVFENSIPGEGLIVYRIDSLASGNASGPPDGIYVYRPGGNPGPAGPQNGSLSLVIEGQSQGVIQVLEPSQRLKRQVLVAHQSELQTFLPIFCYTAVDQLP